MNQKSHSAKLVNPKSLSKGQSALTKQDHSLNLEKLSKSQTTSQQLHKNYHH